MTSSHAGAILIVTGGGACDCIGSRVAEKERHRGHHRVDRAGTHRRLAGQVMRRGSFLASTLLRLDVNGFNVMSILIAFAGACIVIAISRAFTKRSRPGVAAQRSIRRSDAGFGFNTGSHLRWCVDRGLDRFPRHRPGLVSRRWSRPGRHRMKWSS